MSVLETIAERRSIFDFQPTAVPRERIERVLQAAVWAPNHKLTEPWRFIVVGPACKRRLSEVYARIKQDDVPVDIAPEALAEIGRKAIKKLMSKPTVMAVTCAVSGDPMLDREDYAATCCAIQNIMLAAWEDGIGMQWSTSGLIENAEALSVLGVDPEREHVVGLLYAGFADRVPTSARKPAVELTTWLS
ncbi:MAG: nitroreductase [Spirochaetaceae bacterium]|nr:nitroreductase [Spirochaetaceae bacterium]